MTLPKIDLPIYELTLPSTGETVRVRPFIVKEEKLLLMALASKDDQQIIDTTKQIINNCLLDDINVSKLSFFDIDYLFIALRAKSVGESVEIRCICNNRLEDGRKCGFEYPAKLDIANITVYNLDQPKTIKLTDKMVFTMKYPTYDMMKILSSKEDGFEKKIKIVASCIDKIFDGEQYHSAKDHSKEELEAMIEGMTEEQFKKLEAFVNNLPYFKVKSEQDCPKCGAHHKVEYKDFTSFFF